jgi:hypothetical protein
MYSARTAILVRIYLTLVSVSLLLIAIHVYRHFPAIFAPRDPMAQSVLTPSREPSQGFGSRPMINWGGQKR